MQKRKDSDFPFCPHGVPLEDVLFLMDHFMVSWKTTGEIIVVERSKIECQESENQKQLFLQKRQA